MPDDTLSLLSTSAAPAAHAAMRMPLCLADVPLQTPAHVVGLRAVAAGRDAHELALRLLEIGFVEGEPVRVIAHGHPGREPIAVRVGGTTFALRRFEAEQVLVALGVAAHPAA